MKNFNLTILALSLVTASALADKVQQGINNSVNTAVGGLIYGSALGDSNDRRKHSETGQTQAAIGQATAVATGVALIGEAIPLLTSPIPSDNIAGAELMAKAGLEFKQAGADSGVASQNGSQAALLSTEGASAHVGYNPSAAAAEIAEKINSSGYGAVLAANGTDVSALASGLASGNITTADSVATATGTSFSSASEEDLAKGQALGDLRTGSVLSQQNDGAANSVSFGSNGAKRDLAGGLTGAGDGSTSRLLSAAGADPKVSGKDALDMTTSQTAAAILQQREAERLAALGKQESIDGPYDFSLIQALFGKLYPENKKVAASQQALAVKGRLEKSGVKLMRTRENIFQVANRNYKDYKVWRRMSSRVALSN